MGKPVLPLIFRELKERGGYWYWALECITGLNPAASAASIEEATRTWLEFAASAHYIDVDKGRLKELFPNIGEEFEITSDADDNYSCVSWSVNDTKRYWWPYRSVSPYIYWPPGLLREETVEAFVALYEYCMFTQVREPGL
jgi:hypothetical protein